MARRAMSEDQKINLGHFHTYNPGTVSSIVKTQLQVIYQLFKKATRKIQCLQGRGKCLKMRTGWATDSLGMQ